MSSDHGVFWDKKLGKYQSESWAGKPSIFAIEAAKHFPREGRLLELGAGNGQDSRWFAGQGYSVVATDLTDRIKVLASVPNIEVKIVDMSTKLPFGEAQFDVVYSHLALHYFRWQRTEVLFDEIYSCLKPGGIFAALVNSTQDPEITEGREIEPYFREIDGIDKRFFDIAAMRELTSRYETILLDDKGTSHKDKAKGIFQLVRFIGRKSIK